MKSLSLVFVLILRTATAGIPKPDLSIGLNAGLDTNTAGTLGGITPRVKWQSEETSVAGFDVVGGIDVTITDVKETPKTIVWGIMKRVIPKFGVLSIRGDMDANAREVLDLDFRATGYGTSIQMVGSADINEQTVSVDKVQLTNSFDVLGGTLSWNPKYDLNTKVPDVSVGYAVGTTSFKVDAEQKKLTIAHTFGDNNNKISPTITAAGDFSLSYSRGVHGGKLTTTYTPDQSIKVTWNDGGWDATILAPLDGYYNTNSGIKIYVQRNVDVPL